MKGCSTFNFSILAAVAVAFVGTCYADRSEKDIPGVAVENGSFTTLVAALSATDLVGAISSPAGPFTVFAPTDEAFDALPNGLVECLLEERNLPILSDILLYHVVSGEALSTNLSNNQQLSTLLDGVKVTVDPSRNTGVMINDATVVSADVLASNGVIHIIDQVLVPPGLNVGAILQSCQGQGHGNGGSSHSMMPPPSHHNNNGGCIFLGMHRSVGQYLVGPTHTCLCTYGIGWTQCRPNHQDDASSSLVDIPTTAFDWDDHDDASSSLVDIPTTAYDWDDHDDATSSLVDIPTTAVNAGTFSTLVAALSATDLVGAVSEPKGPFTVFAPTDDAFNALPNGLVSCLLKEQNLSILSDILLYHVASGEALSTDLRNNQQISTLLDGAKVTVDLKNNGVKIDGSTVIGADVRASNGVIHIIDAVLVPPGLDVGAFLQTCNGGGGGASSSSSSSSLVVIPTTAINAGIFSTLMAALSATDLVGALSEPASPLTVYAPNDDAFNAYLVGALAEPNGPYTVFAPLDDAFNALPNGLVSCLLEEKNLPILSEILLYHVASGTALSTDLSNRQQLSTLLEGAKVTVNLKKNGGVNINESKVITANVLASNGVIHSIDQVLIPPRIDVGAFLQTCNGGSGGGASSSSSSLVDIPTTAINAGIFSTLVAALSATDLVGALAKPNGPYTVFAPLDDAFDALPDGLVSCLLEKKNLPILSDILLYHVASGEALSTDLSDGQRISTLLEGAKVTVDLKNNGGVKINDSNVITANVQASNGVIHIIDQVLVPPGLNVGAILQTFCRGSGNGIRGSSSQHASVVQQPPYGHHTNNYNNHNDSTCIYLGMQRWAGQYLVGPTHTCLCTYGGAWTRTQCRPNNHW